MEAQWQRVPGLAGCNAGDNYYKPDDILVSCAFCHTSAPTGPGAGFNQRVLTVNNELLSQDKFVTTTGTYTATAPIAASSDWNIILVALKGSVIDQKPLAGTCILKASSTGIVSLVNRLSGSVTTQWSVPAS